MDSGEDLQHLEGRGQNQSQLENSIFNDHSLHLFLLDRSSLPKHSKVRMVPFKKLRKDEKKQHFTNKSHNYILSFIK